MFFHSSKKGFRLTLLAVAACALTSMVLGQLLVVPSAKAQTRRFAVSGQPLTPVGKISSSRKEVRPSQALPREGVRKGATRGQLKPTLVPVACDVTIATGASPAGGYLPLSGFGISPVAGVQDDSVTDFDTPAYTFAGETYTKIGFASNGYAIIGGTLGPGDNTSVNQNLPDPTSPNNVLAPFWTDLDPDNGGALRIGVLTDGSDNWVVLDWEAVSEFSTVNQNSFQIWIGLNGDAHPGEDVSYAYGTLQGSGNGGFLTVGAENKAGLRGQNYYLNGAGTLPTNGTQLRVNTTSCAATRPWSAAGSTGTIDEDSVANASVLNFTLGFNPAVTGTISARYNITSTQSISRFCPATSSRISIRYRDDDASGTSEQVLLTIHRSSIASGGNSTIFTFDSNVSAQPLGAAFQTFTTDAPIDFDFGTNIYWVEVQISRANSAGFVNFGSVQIAESAGTSCP